MFDFITRPRPAEHFTEKNFYPSEKTPAPETSFAAVLDRSMAHDTRSHENTEARHTSAVEEKPVNTEQQLPQAPTQAAEEKIDYHGRENRTDKESTHDTSTDESIIRETSAPVQDTHDEAVQPAEETGAKNAALSEKNKKDLMGDDTGADKLFTGDIAGIIALISADIIKTAEMALSGEETGTKPAVRKSNIKPAPGAEKNNAAAGKTQDTAAQSIIIDKSFLKRLVDTFRTGIEDSSAPKQDSGRFNNLLARIEKKISETKENTVNLPVQAAGLIAAVSVRNAAEKIHRAQRSTDSTAENNNRVELSVIKNEAALMKAVVSELNTGSDSSPDTAKQDSGFKDNPLFQTLVKHDQLQRGVQSAAHTKQPGFSEQLHEMVNNAKISVRDGKNGSFTIKLHPRQLGNVNVNLSLENGTLHSRFLVDTEGAKQLLLSNISDYTSQLKEAGIDVGSFSVDVRGDGQSRQARPETEKNLNGIKAANEKAALVMEYTGTSGVIHPGSINMVI